MYTFGRVFFGSLLILSFCLTPLSHADEARKDSFQCKAEESYLEFLSGLGDAYSPDESFSCFQSIEEADYEHSLIVDIRSASTFQKVRIPNSINLTKLELLSTQGIQSRPILVVDKGFSRTALAQMCAKAEAEGFKTFKVLLGGVAAWHASGRELEGLPEHFSDLHSIEPNEFLIELKQNRLSVLATDAYSEYLKAIAPPELVISKLDGERMLDRQLLSHVQRVGSGEQFPVVLLGANSSVVKSSPVLRSVFTLDISARNLAAVYQGHLEIAEKRKAIPDRFRCRG
ncbi:MAG: rhodanese-like domain-containing protein [Oceanospirillales bacterium]|jgi:rhodanese-related sulfurtransferase|nr:rhodanese-like domain-containing protein [Oceanospirillales bacterium]